MGLATGADVAISIAILIITILIIAKVAIKIYSNAILNYGGGSLEGSKIYVTLFPCNECAKAIIQSGIKTVVYAQNKYDGTPSVEASKRLMNAAGVRYYQYQPTGKKLIIEV